jgi:hypothetical protein
MLAQVRFDQRAGLARMVPAGRRADRLKPLPPIAGVAGAGSVRTGEQLARVAVLGILVLGQVRRQRGHRERADAGRFGCCAFQQQPCGLRDFRGRNAQGHSQEHQVGREHLLRELGGEGSGDVGGAGRRVAQLLEAFG